MPNPSLRATLFAAVLFLLAPFALAANVPAVGEDPELDKRVTKIAEILRCLVCQNQTIADSHAELAVDLKNQIREKLLEGKSEQEIVDFMVQRYGDFVLYNPPVKTTTWMLWFGPFLLLVIGIGVLFSKLRQRARVVREATLTEAEEQRARALLGDSEKQGSA